MNPEQKAKELVEKFRESIYTDYYENPDKNSYTYKKYLGKSKQCTFICVDEIIKTCNKIVQSNDVAPYYNEKYWQEVMNEIEKL